MGVAPPVTSPIMLMASRHFLFLLALLRSPLKGSFEGYLTLLLMPLFAPLFLVAHLLLLDFSFTLSQEGSGKREHVKEREKLKDKILTAWKGQIGPTNFSR